MSRAIIAAYIITTSLALILLRLGSKDGAPVSFINGRLSFNITILIVAGVVSFGISFLLYTYLLSVFDLGFIVPLTTGIVYAIIFVASYFLFHESFSPLKLFAIALIFIGVILLNVSSSGQNENASDISPGQINASHDS
jgi:small multidrug resistance pump